ncbi:unnamed protein product [Ostreobium quekettii]|uniref:Uncharacterized protein n=1 Tax=Ostreobium quekettii TaxID=121088 RepID=A0A8S1J8F4_9CHLO|nr:unnamed protein product [Ostreobium quekettii]
MTNVWNFHVACEDIHSVNRTSACGHALVSALPKKWRGGSRCHRNASRWKDGRLEAGVVLQVVSQSNDGCTCREGTFRFSNASANEPFDFGECRTCDGEDMVPSVTGRYCVQCDGTSGTEGILDGGFRVGNDERWQPAIKSGDTCVCATPVANSVVTEYGIHGTPFTSNGVLVMRCLVCPEGTIVHDGRCTACRHPTVLTADGQCSCGDIVPCFEEGKEIQYIADELNIFAQGSLQLCARCVWEGCTSAG